MLVQIHDTGSITAAAAAMNVTQSTVSHGLKRLRAIADDELFVPLGRGIAPTERADQLVLEAREILERMARFARSEAYAPGHDTLPFTIAATDYEVEMIIKPFVRQLREAAPRVQLRVVRARPDREWVALLRSGEVDLVLAPELTTAESDIKQRRVLHDDNDTVYYDAQQRGAPDKLDAYCAADHIIVAPGSFGKTLVDHALAELGRTRRIAVSLPSFASVATVLRGTDMVAMMPWRLHSSFFSGLAYCPLPVSLPPDAIASIWHIKADTSPRHAWMREQIRLCAQGQTSAGVDA